MDERGKRQRETGKENIRKEDVLEREERAGETEKERRREVRQRKGNKKNGGKKGKREERRKGRGGKEKKREQGEEKERRGEERGRSERRRGKVGEGRTERSHSLAHSPKATMSKVVTDTYWDPGKTIQTTNVVSGTQVLAVSPAPV